MNETETRIQATVHLVNLHYAAAQLLQRIDTLPFEELAAGGARTEQESLRHTLSEVGNWLRQT